MPALHSISSAASMIWHELLRAWLTPIVRRGFYGTVLICLGALSPAYLPTTSPWWRLAHMVGATGMVGRSLATIITMSGLFLLVDSWFRLRPRRFGSGRYAYQNLRHWAILAIWGSAFIFAPPIFSHDAYSYAAQGWLVHNGINPYHAGPAVLPGSFADQVAWIWRDTPAPYGPLSLRISHLMVMLVGLRPYASAVAMRIPSLISVAIIGLLIPRIAHQRRANPAAAAWFATLNPVVVIDFIGGCHNDSWMMACVLLAMWLTGRGSEKTSEIPAHSLNFFQRIAVKTAPWWWIAGAVLIGVGASIKQPAILAAYILPLMVRPWKDYSFKEVAINLGRIFLSGGVAIASFCLISWGSGLGFGWINAVKVPGLVITIAPFTVIGQVIQFFVNLAHLDPTRWAAISFMRTVGVVLAAVTITVMAFTLARRRPVRFLAFAYLLAALALPAVRSWYILWGGLILPLSRPSRSMMSAAIWVTIVLLSYNAVNMAWRNDAVAFGGALVVGVGLLACVHQSVHRQDHHRWLGWKKHVA